MVLRRSIRMVVPRFCLPDRCSPGRMLSLSECLSGLLPRSGDPQLSRWTRPVSLGGKPVRTSPCRDTIRNARYGALQLMYSTPNPSSGPFPARFLRPEFSLNSGHKHPAPAASTGGRSGYSGTLLGATGGTQTHSRRTGRKLRQLLDARQGLVRVPESNTKYGGKWRKTGDGPGLFSSQVSVSPQGFPSEKIVLRGGEFRLLPLFTGQLFIGVLGLRLGDLGKTTESAGLISRPAAGNGRRLAAMPEFSPRFPPVGLSGSV